MVHWYRRDSADIPKSIRQLTAPRAGWTPRDWRLRLLQLAERCEQVNPERADELRRAAALMDQEH